MDDRTKMCVVPVDRGQRVQMPELLLLSTSTLYGQNYLQYAVDPISEWLAGAKELLFIPYALKDHDAYTEAVQQALAPSGVRVIGGHSVSDPSRVFKDTGRIFVGGGNSFRLLKTLYAKNLLDEIRHEVLFNQARYLGSSAGTNMACPSLRTTNDMPIVEPPSFEALGLVEYQINPHYLDPMPDLHHMGETRETRINEFLEENDLPVIGLREGSWLRQSGNVTTLKGSTARWFVKGREPIELDTGVEIEKLPSDPISFSE